MGAPNPPWSFFGVIFFLIFRRFLEILVDFPYFPYSPCRFSPTKKTAVLPVRTFTEISRHVQLSGRSAGLLHEVKIGSYLEGKGIISIATICSIYYREYHIVYIYVYIQIYENLHIMDMSKSTLYTPTKYVTIIVCMYMYVYILYIYLLWKLLGPYSKYEYYINIHIYINTYIYIYIYTYIYIHIYIYIYIYIYMYFIM